MTFSVLADQLRTSLERHLGLRLPDDRLPEIERLLRARVRAVGAPTAGAYLREHLDGLGRDEEIARLAAEITVPETWFFRDPAQLAMVTDEIRRRAAAARPVRMLSAGCATGEEAYTLAMLARDALGERPACEVIGVDVNPVALQFAERGAYPAWSLRQTPAEAAARFFRARKGLHVVRDEVRADVRFARLNLAGPWPLPWPEGTFDVVCCRNVLMYLAPDAAARVLERLVRVLAPGGLLLLGHADRVGACADRLELVQAPGAFGWRRTLPASAAPPRPRRVGARPPRRAALRRIPEPSAVVAAPRAPIRAVDAGPPPLDGLIALLEAEQFEAAQRALRDARAAVWTDAHRLLAAALPLHLGLTVQARAAGEDLLGVDEAAADAHHLLGLCAEHGGDESGAVSQHEAAIYYDPAFATAHLHLGRLLRRRAQVGAALRHLRLALSLLEDESRLRMAAFAPGVGRAGLSAWARAEIRACVGDA